MQPMKKARTRIKTATARRPIPINEAEAVIDAFWDRQLAPCSDYVLSAPGTRRRVSAASGDPVGPSGARAAQAWCWLTFSWQRPASGASATVLAFERTTQVDLDGYDRLIVRLSVPPHVRVTLRARIDGRRQTVIAGVAGRGALQEFEGRVRGRRLSHLRLELATDRPGPAEVWLDWIGCARSAARRALLAQPTPFTPDWSRWLEPAGARVGWKPRFGLFFDARELAALRRKARSAPYRPLLDRLRAIARAAMRFRPTPEEQIGPLIGCGDNSTTLVRVRDLATRSYHADAPICALVGLIDRDAACLRFAARIAVSLAHHRTWAPHFMQEFPGSTWDQRGFPEAFALVGVTLALDWAGPWFTPAGEELVRNAIATKGLPRVRQAFLQHEYMLDCNQSHMIVLGRLLGLLVLERAWPRTRVDVDICARDILEIIDRYIRADGSTDEGLHYWNSSFRSVVPALVALARHRRQPLARLVPAKLRAMDGFIGTLLSTVGEPGAYLPMADTVADSLSIDAIAMMAKATGSPFWQALMGDCLRRGKRPKDERWCCDGPFAVIHGPARVPRRRLRLPAFARLRTAGHVSSCRRLVDTDVRLFLVGAAAQAGHCHRDKGSFILEADGEAFAIDRGMVPYHDSGNLPFLKSEVAHNLAVPVGVQQWNPAPVAVRWRARGDAVRLVAAVDTGGTWQSLVRACRRTIRSPRPDVIEVCDEFTLAEPTAVVFYLHTPLPVRVEARAVTVRGSRRNLTVTTDWAVARAAGPCGVNWRYEPINRLELTSAAARRHCLRTVLTFGA
jgi:hypothetical protein